MPEHKELEASIFTIEQLKKFTYFSPEEEAQLGQVIQIHPMRVSPYYLSLIDWNDPDDPIRKMALPSVEELNLEGFYDTSGETENTKMPGLQHKYSETALILATNRCAVYCRHCFRKRLVGLPSEEIVKRFEEAAEYIAEHKEINNVLISGGDPLVLKTEIIERFLRALAKIDHLSFIRFGSRVPVTLPARLNGPNLLALLKKYSKKDKRLYVVTQFNHPREITPQSIKAVSNLLKAGVLLSNQTVLLRGVNDDPCTLATLMNRLVSIGVAPYYVFQCRPVKRVKHHFQVPICEGVRIVEKAKVNCNGHSKRFKYIMAHKTGKIEVLGIMNGEIYFKYHQAKDRKNLGVMFKRQVDEQAGWLDDLKTDAKAD
ncbi:KamA family radical SAM protein [Candidatus Bathyarchaeota archaeon A05DMB-2]|jgi:KamA family protein|nr:KamA family radical SAM protein [Candidatus Bathyarchaeota archaeon A05DMB-2]